MLRFVSRIVPVLLFAAVCFTGLASAGPVSRQPNDQIIHPNDLRPPAELNGSAVIATDSDRTIEKRSVNDNIFEDDDDSKSNNVDYIDFSNLYKDEVARDGNNGKSHEKFELEQNKNKKRMVKNRREKLKEKKKRKKKRKHKQSRFKRRDDGERRLFRAKLRPVTNPNPISLDPANQTVNAGRAIDRPSTSLISLECEDRLHCLLRHVANGENNKQASPDEKKLNKILDYLTKNGQKVGNSQIVF